MPVSRDFTAGRIWAEAVRDVGGDAHLIPHWERFLLINRAVTTSAPLWYGLVSIAYMVRATATPTGDTVSLRLLRPMQSALHKVELESTVTNAVEAVSTLALNRWRSSAVQNRKKIVFSVAGDRVFLKKGDGLTSYGTLTLRYPRVPIEVTADTDKVDVPDDSAIQIVLSFLKKILAERMKVKADYSDEIVRAVQAINAAFGIETELEEVKSRVAKLM